MIAPPVRQIIPGMMMGYATSLDIGRAKVYRLWTINTEVTSGQVHWDCTRRTPLALAEAARTEMSLVGVTSGWDNLCDTSTCRICDYADSGYEAAPCVA